MKFSIKVSYRDCPEEQPWIEPYNRSDITTEDEAREYADRIITNFNLTLRDGERARKLLGVFFDVENNEKAQHVWTKTNLMTVLDPRLGMYDTLRCTVCGITAKRFRLTTIKIDSKYRAKGYRVCPPAVKGFQS